MGAGEGEGEGDAIISYKNVFLCKKKFE